MLSKMTQRFAAFTYEDLKTKRITALSHQTVEAKSRQSSPADQAGGWARLLAFSDEDLLESFAKFSTFPNKQLNDRSGIVICSLNTSPSALAAPETAINTIE